MFILFGIQIALGFAMLFNPIPFEWIMRIFGLFLIAISPLWLVMFRLERAIKQQQDQAKEKGTDPHIG